MGGRTATAMVILAMAGLGLPSLNWPGGLLPAAAAGEPEAGANGKKVTYPIVDTGQVHCFSDRGQLTSPPGAGQAYYGQDAHYQGNQPSYRDNGDGTVSDLVTGLMWTARIGDKISFNDAVAGAKTCRVGGHTDWRLPTIKELYSLMDFNGCVTTPTPRPYLDTKYFQFRWGNDDGSGRIIDSQFWSATQYVGTTMGGAATVFGVNFADGRIKGYPRGMGRNNGRDRHFVRYVRGNPAYGVNRFVDNGDGTVSDLATGLMWSKADNGGTVDWQGALAWAEGLERGGDSDWRLPDAKELQSIVDYTRAPDAGNAAKRSAAIDPVFDVSRTESYFWSSTTHLDGPTMGMRGVYVAFGRAMGNMHDRRTGQRRWMNVHGAGAQRSDPKSGDPSKYASGMGPQGDDIRIFNYARAVRSIEPGAVKVVRPSTERIKLQPGRPPGETGQSGPGMQDGSGPGGQGGPGMQNGSGRPRRGPGR